MKSVERNILKLLLVRIPTSLFTLAWVVLLARMMGPKIFGNYQYINTNILLAIMFLSLHGSHGLIYFASKADVRTKAVERLSGQLITGGTLLVFAVALLSRLWSPLSEFLFAEEYGTAVLMIFFVCSYFFQKATLFLESLMKGVHAFDSFNRGTLFAAVWTTLCYGVGTIVLRDTQQMTPYLWTVLMAQGGGALLLVLLWNRVRKREEAAEDQTQLGLRAYWHYVKLGYASHLTRFLNKRFDVWIIEAFRGLTSLGYYQLANSFNQFVINAVQPVNQMMMREVQPESLNKEAFARHIRVISGVVLAGALALIALFPWLIPFLFGAAFEPAVPVARILALTTYFVTLTNGLAIYQYTHHQLGRTWTAQIIGLVVILALDLWWIPHYGITGAAWASVCSYGVTTAYMLVRVANSLKIRWTRLLIPRWADLKHYR